MSDISVSVTNAGAAGVTVTNGSTVNTVVGDGGSVLVSIGTVSPGDASVVSGTVQLGKVTTLAPGSNVTIANSGTAYSAVLDFGIPGTATNASLLSEGTIPDARLSANVPLMTGGLIQAVNLPSFVDDVIEVSTLPGTGEAGKIYTVLTGASVNKIYRWSGSAFIEISPSPGSTDAVPEGANLYFTTTRAAAAAPVQSVAGRQGAISLTSSDVGLNNVNNTSDADKPVSTAQAAADAAVSSAAASDATSKADNARTHAVQRKNHTGTQAISTVDGLQAALDAASGGSSYSLPTASSSVLGGIKIGSGLSIDGNGVVTAASGGSGGGSGSASLVYAATPSGFPATGTTANLYIASDTQRAYRWDAGGFYVEVGPL